MKRLTAVLIPMLLLVASLCAQPPKMTQFSSDMQMKTARGETMTGKYYMGDHKMRMDMNTHGMDVIMINDLNKKKSYMLMPAQKMVMEHDINQPARGPMGNTPKFEPECDPDHFTCKVAGTETVNGRLCEKWVYTAKDPGNEAANQTVWVDQKIHTPVRVITGDGSQMDFTNIKEGTQAESLFQVPSDYQPFNPMGMMGGRPPRK